VSGRGRPARYTQELADLICERLAEGEPLRQICRDEGMPAASTVRLWIVDDVNGFSAQYARAREIQAHTMAEEILEIADDARNDWMERQDDKGGAGYDFMGEHVQRSKLRSENRKWLLSKMLPKVYGERLDINADVRTQTVSAEPMSEDEWNREHARGGVAPPKGTAT
jgi:hypothetical protein